MTKKCCNINEVIKEFYNYLKAYITGKVNSTVIAEDLVQEVMFKLVEAHHKNTEVKNIKAWLFQISRNTIYDYFKQHQLELSLVNDFSIANLKDDKEFQLNEFDYIVPMIDLLPASYAVPLKLSDIDGLSQKEIAEQLTLGLSATKMRIQRARVKLQELFVECCHITYDAQGNFSSCIIKDSCTPLQQVKQDISSSL